jgi:hypothetical protein
MALLVFFLFESLQEFGVVFRHHKGLRHKLELVAVLPFLLFSYILDHFIFSGEFD